MSPSWMPALKHPAWTPACRAGGNGPGVWNRPGLAYIKASDEHCVLQASPGAAVPALGEKLLLVPGHCDPTVNLYDWYVCVRQGVVEALWPITARGACLLG